MGSKIPSYALTWTFFQSLKGAYSAIKLKRRLLLAEETAVVAAGRHGSGSGSGGSVRTVGGGKSGGDGKSAAGWVEDFFLGAMASGCAVCVMIPMDTVKTRLTTQVASPSPSSSSSPIFLCQHGGGWWAVSRSCCLLPRYDYDVADIVDVGEELQHYSDTQIHT